MENDTGASASERPLQNSGEDLKVILVAVDGSSGASRVLSTAARLSRGGAALHVLHVLKTSRFDHARAGAPQTSADSVEDAKEQLAAHVRSAKAQTRSEVTGHFLVGDPQTEVLRFTEQIKADMLVVGTHDLTGLDRLILGSIAESLVRKAHCSVLVVRPRK